MRFLRLIGAITLIPILFGIASRTTDDIPYFLLGAAALIVGTALQYVTYPVDTSGRRFDWPKAGIALFLSFVGTLATVLVAERSPDQKIILPLLIPSLFMIWELCKEWRRPL